MATHSFRALSFSAAVLLLAGCGGGLAQAPGAPSIASLVGLPVPGAIALQQHPDTSKSWVAPNAKSTKILLYVADQYTNDVNIYEYKSGATVGKITGFSLPYGLCVDAIGDVFVTSYYSATVIEYAHGSKTQVEKLDTGGNAIGCSVSPSGDLAVSNYGSPGGAGSLVVFPNATGKPIRYTNSKFYYPWAPGYDSHGNLYVEAADEGLQTSVYELPLGGTSLKSVTCTQRINLAAGVMWDGKFITLADQGYAADTTEIYQATESPSGDLTLVGATNLRGEGSCIQVSIAQPFVVGKENTPINLVQGSAVVGGNIDCGDQTFGYWNYPEGGLPSKELSMPTVVRRSIDAMPDKITTEYWGQAVSIKEGG